MGYYLEEHPNLPGRPAQYGWPRTWASGVIGVHTTESGVIPTGADPGAENTAAFISTRADYGSYHIIADWDTIVPMTRPTFAAWADTTNNVHALSVSGAMDAARWRDITPDRAAGIVRNMGIAAAMLARDAVAQGVLQEVPPARRITAQQAIDGTAAGFYGHGETNPGTRYDPGTNFDWDLFLATYAAAVGGGINYQSTTVQEDDMFESADRTNLETTLGKVETLIGMLNNVAGGVNGIPSAVLDKQVPRANNPDATTSLALFLSYSDADREATVSRIKDAITTIPAPELAAQIDAAGLAASVRDELVKLLGGK